MYFDINWHKFAVVVLRSTTGRSWHDTAEWPTTGRGERNVAITSPELMTLVRIHCQSRRFCSPHNSAENSMKCTWVKKSPGEHCFAQHEFPALQSCVSLLPKADRTPAPAAIPTSELGAGLRHLKNCIQLLQNDISSRDTCWQSLKQNIHTFKDMTEAKNKTKNLQDFIFTHSSIPHLWDNVLLITYHDPWSI